MQKGACEHGTIYSAWTNYKGFPAQVRAIHRQFKSYGGSILWGPANSSDKFGLARVALLARNERLVDAATGLVAFITKSSRGSIFTIKKAVQKHLCLVVFPVNCELPKLPSVKWKELSCGGTWDGGYKAVYLK